MKVRSRIDEDENVVLLALGTTCSGARMYGA